MTRSLFKSIALTSVFLATGALQLSVSAKTSTSTLKLKNPIVPTSSSIKIAQSTTDLASIEQAVNNQVNQYRANRGLPPLTLNATISEQARNHSRNMASGAVPFSHDGFAQRVQAIATQIPYRGAAENVANNSGYGDPATKAVQSWLNSSGHRKNIEGNYNLTGIGVAKNSRGVYYLTQIFVLTR
jgi:uncharacterized protein YkwD